MTYARSKTRKFLFDYFNDNELTNLCFDYFPLVENNFTLGMGKDQKIRELIVYCENRGKTADLLAAVERERPDLYAEELKVDQERPLPKPVSTRSERKPNQIFLSHSSEDAEIASQLATMLRQNGWKIWMAPDSIFPGEKWAEAINRGLEESGIFLLLMTEAVLRSRWVKSETNFAIEMEHRGEMRFIPLAHDNVEYPPLWRGYQWIPFSTLSQANLDVLLATLAGQKIVSPAAETIVQNELIKDQPPVQEPVTNRVNSDQPKFIEKTFYGLPVWSWGISLIVILAIGAWQIFGFWGEGSIPTVQNRLSSDFFCGNVAVAVDDADGDGLSAAEESIADTDPENGDTDGDQLCDGYEINFSGTNPNEIDSNGNGVNDFDTVFPDGIKSLNPTAPAIVNGHEWIEISAGSFLMGANDEDQLASNDEKPQHSLSLDTFWMSQYETTNGQYKLFVDAGNAQHAPTPNCNVWGSDGTFPERLEDHPIVCVTWYDAIAYVEWLANETGDDIRLPSEAEWEKAARGEYGLIYPWDDAFDGTRINCNFEGCPQSGFNGTLPVGSFPDGASPYEVEDMAGNVWEWTRSYYTPYPYVATDGRENASLGEGFNWVLRGGSFLNTEENFRGSHRTGVEPGAQIHDFGFRVVNWSGGD